MFPHQRMPYHITILYICSVVNLVALFHVTLVAAKVKVISPKNLVVFECEDRELLPYEIRLDGIKGPIEESKPSNGCSTIAPASVHNFSLSQLVLISVADCGDSLKIRNAKHAKYDAVILYGSFDDFHTNMTNLSDPSVDPRYPLPTVQIREEDGITIRDHYQQGSGYIIEITSNSYSYSFSTYMILFAIVIGLCFIVMLIFVVGLIVKCVQDRRRNRRNRLSSRHLKQIPTAKFAKGDQYDVCAICLEDYNEGDKLRILPCSHAYHAKCIDPWLTNNRRTCPLCKRKIHFGDSSSDSESDSDGGSSPAETTPLLQSHHDARTEWGTFARPYNHPLVGATASDVRGTSPEEFEPAQQDLLNQTTANTSIQTIHADLHSSQNGAHCLPPPFNSVNAEDDSCLDTTLHSLMDRPHTLTVELSHNVRNSDDHQGLIV